MDINVYGTGTSGHQMIVQVIEDFLSKAKIKYNLREITDVNMFLASSLESIPAVQIDDLDPVSIGQDQLFNSKLRSFIKNLLKSCDYGKLTRVLLLFDFSKESRNAFNYTYQLFSESKTIIKLLNIDHSHNLVGGFEVSKTIRKDLLKESCKRLEGFIQTVESEWASDLMTNCIVDKICLKGEGDLEVSKVFKREKSNMLVMGVNPNSHADITNVVNIATMVSTSLLILPDGTSFDNKVSFKHIFFGSSIQNHSNPTIMDDFLHSPNTLQNNSNRDALPKIAHHYMTNVNNELNDIDLAKSIIVLNKNDQGELMEKLKTILKLQIKKNIYTPVLIQ